MWQQCVQRGTGAGALGHFLPTEAEKEVGDQTGLKGRGKTLIPEQRTAPVRGRGERDGAEACPGFVCVRTGNAAERGKSVSGEPRDTSGPVVSAAQFSECARLYTNNTHIYTLPRA